MPRICAAAAAMTLLLVSPLSHAQPDNCEAIRAQIEAKIRGAGVASFSLRIVDAEAELAGEVVGTCGLGTKKIVYSRGAAPASASAPPEARPSGGRILTECKDGSVTYGACKK